MKIKTLVLSIFILFVNYVCEAQDGVFSTLSFTTLIKGNGPTDYSGWGQGGNDVFDLRTNSSNGSSFYMNHHYGLSFSAHSFYGGIRFYNQSNSGNPYDEATGAKMVMSISNGNVGIGTISPSSVLHVNGVASLRSSVPTDGYLTINPGGPTTQGYINWWKPGNTRVAYMGYNDGSSYNNLGLTLEGANFIVNGGNVGIGTTDPRGYKLAVNGKIRTQEIRVENSNWPDYVFTKYYQLPTLQETEKHIKEKGHLPGIPSAAEVKANGIDLGEMNGKLLQKIEELTLHLIEMKKENKNLTKRVSQLENNK